MVEYRWRSGELSAFWAELGSCEHFVQVYDNDDAFLTSLSDFIYGALERGTAAVVIATEGHRRALEARLGARGIDLAACSRQDRYIALDAEQTLNRFLVNGWPDADLFTSVIQGILRRARGMAGRRIVAFGEMVALLWARGHSEATIKLEILWKEICEKKLFQLFCAYPKTGFADDPATSIARVCRLHSKILTA